MKFLYMLNGHIEIEASTRDEADAVHARLVDTLRLSGRVIDLRRAQLEISTYSVQLPDGTSEEL